jgi:hypothetical protein
LVHAQRKNLSAPASNSIDIAGPGIPSIIVPVRVAGSEFMGMAHREPAARDAYRWRPSMYPMSRPARHDDRRRSR